MKVSITKESKKVLTLEEAQAARQIILDRKEDEWSVTEYAEIAVLRYSRQRLKLIRIAVRGMSTAKTAVRWTFGLRPLRRHPRASASSGFTSRTSGILAMTTMRKLLLICTLENL